jgi:hypothetical protein
MVMVILAVLYTGYGCISLTTWLWLYQQCYILVMVILAVLHSGYGYISSATKWLWLY